MDIKERQGSLRRLADEKSPYLIQHADNPVEWYPWGEEAFERAAREDKPLFLSIGYSTCHWCHVMAHESFEDDRVATFLNEHFISIKVDREERPDVDAVYMAACLAMTGSGGWPLTLFLTPEKLPFFAGTYFPKTSRPGVPGFLDLLHRVVEAWRHDRGRIDEAGREITAHLKKVHKSEGGGTIDESQLHRGYTELERAYDPLRAGFGPAPKFPIPHHLMFLVRMYRQGGNDRALGMATETLDRIRNGGIFDQVGLGVHRYATDNTWLVPHFEKMLYDQALVSLAAVEVFQITGNRRYADIADDIHAYVLGRMTDRMGGFYTAEDADSDGGEGRFYTWTPREVREILDRNEAEIACGFFGITEGGNFEDGRSIPHVTSSPDEFAASRGIDPGGCIEKIEEIRKKLFAAREGRPRPLLDDKIITGLNGLMIASLARAGRVLGDNRRISAARRAADFVLRELTDDRGGLFRRYRRGDRTQPGFLDDYAYFTWGLLELFEASGEPTYLERAVHFTDEMKRRFYDPDGGGYFLSDRFAEKMIIAQKDYHDTAVPSGSSVAALNLVRLFEFTGLDEYRVSAGELIADMAQEAGRYPSSHTMYLTALDVHLSSSMRAVVVGRKGDPATERMRKIAGRYLSLGSVLIYKDIDDNTGLLEKIAPDTGSMRMVDGRATVYLCRNRTCMEPVTDPQVMKSVLKEGGSALHEGR
ncbi:MAG: thioredoxin domain-containing protein [Deltaproteobacteria bacterium]|nr:thioredoxin domain-containing protein [Candidatus Zymogenaceae bacterium]